MTRTHKFLISLLLCCFVFSFSRAQTQNGDQILDGIGETGLIARYLFDGNAKDWSRNNLHGTLQGSNMSFVTDAKFGQVLSLSGAAKDYVLLPSEAIAAEESLTIVGWVYMSSTQPDQYLFDVGKNTKSHFSVVPIGTKKKIGFQSRITANANEVYSTHSASLLPNQWSHIAVVLNIPTSTMSTYINGVLVAENREVSLDLKQVFYNNNNKNKFYIGKSLIGKAPNLKAKLHDLRIYRIPLNSKQIFRIHRNGLNSDATVVNEKKGPVDDLPVFSVNTPQLYNQYLIDIPNIHVETEVGFLPRLPRYVDAVYGNGIRDVPARVIWPAPKDNHDVLKAGDYTIIGFVPGTNLRPKAFVKVKAVKAAKTPNRSLEVFSLDAVSLNTDVYGRETKFIENRTKFITTLSKTNPDDFLYMFRNAFGQEQPKGAVALGVWDTQETKLRGHATGHYLTAIAQAYASTAYDISLQNNFAKKMNYMINVLFKLSKLSGQPVKKGGTFVADPNAVPPGSGKSDFDSDLSIEGIRTDYWNWGKGFISAYPPDQFIMLEKGAIYGTQKTKIWAPYYTLHKILAGLLDVYEVNGNPKALEVAKGMGDWVAARLAQLPTETLIKMWNTYIAGEFGGMNEVMARLYRVTNEQRYLDGAKLFDNIKVFYGDATHSHGLAKNVDTFRGLHANQHIPQILGALEMYRDSGASAYFRIADNFWNKATNDYMYSIGGVAGARNPANAECFISQPATLYENGLSSGGQNETCATYNMLKLTKNLFLFDQRTELMDYYERGLYNHILASVAEDSPANTYHVPLRPGSVKHFGNPEMKGFTCCNGTALESSTKLQNSIYFKSIDNNALYVNLFVPSSLTWKAKNIIIHQTTAFPKEDHSKLTIEGNGKFDLKIRVPQWATKGFFVTINGKKQETKTSPGSYLSLNRSWKSGDTVELRMPFDFHLSPVMDQQNIASLFYGPILLVAQEPAPRTTWRKVSLDANNLGKSIKPQAEKLNFSINGVLYKPFYDTYGRHSVYLDVRLK
ncbi:hypothetical protein GCM10011416_01680 [Polaribacter pacificus]|uniref:DUF1680 family protein n=1 Tax=Polaribacter pacificus TaxID=1775173 RepID=A0A917HTN5_9FLAO|nr:beta-L-arabinofuranosidase domain-containing protein [Polaribacter pacificus]GGG88967.1 hypothetical protein GCM10011416_01680 [Polaribacter pacificus]